ncbi:MAG: uracil-DNA glycosylase family protein [Verrucomicrobiota bacterium]
MDANAHLPSLIAATQALARAVDGFQFPGGYVYNPLRYAWEPHQMYLSRYTGAPKRVLFLGMNPGPFGMAQTGVPFGEIKAVRDWMGIEAPVGKPPREHPGKPVLGFQCPRSEVSGLRLWGLFAARFGTPQAFFTDHFVHNYCPLLFLENTKSGKNVTPEQLPGSDTAALFSLCDEYLRQLVVLLKVEWAIGVGGFAEERLALALQGCNVKIGKVLHPSPASPAANRDWAGTATRQLEAQGVWPRNNTG